MKIMFKKIELWVVLLIILIGLLISIIFGGILRDSYLESNKTPEFSRNISVFISQIPRNIYFFIAGKNKPNKVEKNSNLPKFKRFIKNKRNILLVLPRYNGDLERSVVEIIDIDNFEVLHTYKHDIAEMYNLVDTSKSEHKRLKVDKSPIRFLYKHPLILEDGSLIADSSPSPLFKIDFCSNLLWINQEERFHHSKMIDHNNNIWVAAHMYPYSNLISKKIKEYGFLDDAIVKLNKDGKIEYIKSISEMLAENNIIGDELFLFKKGDPIHLNDIEPAFTDTDYWRKGDLFISIRHQSAIIHYRPSTNAIINYIQGPFYMQHDVDIISDKEISIFNNNNSILENSKNSEVLIYNFETQSFNKKFSDQIMKENFKTPTNGLSEILNDGSMLVEETDYGRLIFFNKEGQKEWEFVNKDSDGNIYVVSWSRIIEDKQLISKLRDKIENTKCLN